ncbi:MAG: aldehyde dehydrogenase [Cellvibrionaceae bacterium]|nr:aldehyde dehydrogenase [Cellvibrionaceae bacterium]
MSSSTNRFERTNPFNGSVASVTHAASIKEALATVNAAKAAFPAWSAMGPHARRAVLLKAADLLEARRSQFIEINQAETGATAPWIGFNVSIGAKILREAASMTTQIAGEVLPSEKPGAFSTGIRQPAGVCLGIAPWNAAIILGVRAIAMPLACGNTAILKASEMSPQTHTMIVQTLLDAGIPKGVVSVISHDPKDAPTIVEALIRSPAIRRVNFTGSTGVGKVIAKLCAEELKPCLLELGGKAPFIVLDDADLEGAVNGAAFGSFMNMGQICMSTERIIVTQGIADQFISALAKKTAALPAGDPAGANVLGSLVSQQAVDRLSALVDDAVQKGASVIAGGNNNGTVFEATLVDGVTPDMRLYSEESFGPVKPIIRVDNAEHAIEVANDTEYGLSGAIYTSNIKQGMALAAQLESGICHINGPTVADEPQAPFGGVKASGIGRFGGKAGIAEFTDLRWITIEDPQQSYPF